MKARLLLAALLLAACSPQHRNSFSGYADGDFLFLSPREPGQLVTLSVREGQEVTQGTALFALDSERHQQAADRAQAQYNSALAHLADLKAGLRPEEVRQLEAAADLAQKTAMRARDLYARGNISKAELDQDEAALAQAKAALANAYGGRANQIEAAAHDAQGAQDALATAVLDLADRTVNAPAPGRVETIFHRPGEMIGAALPVLSFLPVGRLKVKFFVGENDLSRLKIGGHVKVTCDACSAPIDATISFIASEPQFTPPVIYSLEERHKLVYLVEARPAPGLRPGQPVDVSLAP